MSLGENLQFIREKQGLTQEQLAERMGVSRQSVSKWEGDAMMPELEKLTALCELAGCTLDTLLRGDLAAETARDAAGYNAHFDLFARQTAAGVQLVIFSMAAGSFCNFLRFSLRAGAQPAAGPDGAGAVLSGAEAFPAGVSGIVAMLILIPAVALLVLAGMEHSRFTQKHPLIEPFYTAAQLDAHAQWFTRRVVLAIALALVSLTLLMAGGILAGPLGLDPAPCADLFRAVFLALLGAAARILVHAGIQHEKYDIAAYNRQNTPQARALQARIGRISGCIMLAAGAVFLAWGFLLDQWRLSWVALAAGALLCGILSHALSREEGSAPEQRQQKR